MNNNFMDNNYLYIIISKIQVLLTTYGKPKTLCCNNFELNDMEDWFKIISSRYRCSNK